MSEHPKPRSLPPEVASRAPKREDYRTQADYEEAQAYFRHRTRHLARPIPTPHR